MVFVDVEYLKAAQAWVLLDYVVPDVHGLVVRVADACFYIRQVQGLLPFTEPLPLRVPRRRVVQGDLLRLRDTVGELG